jgi:hypothetical protein
MKDEDTVSWNSMVTAYLNRYRIQDAGVILFIVLISFIIIILILSNVTSLLKLPLNLKCITTNLKNKMSYK